MSGELLRVTDLTVEFRGRHRGVRALDAVSLAVSPGETLGLVGESGSGKTTLALAIAGLVTPASGHIRLAGHDLGPDGRRDRRRLSRDLQMVFQDPYSSLSPARTVSQILAEPLQVHESLSRAQARQRITGMLEQVGLPAEAAGRYPSEFSGGQRQRIAIARALMVAPKLVICDEPVSALDMSVQAQILNLLADLQRDLSVAYLFISHDLAVVRYLASRVIVLYRGRVMESGSAETICTRPWHPYTRALLAAVPSPDPAKRPAPGEPAPLAGPPGRPPAQPGGCPYHPRCPLAVDQCRTERPALRAVSTTAQAACHLLSAADSGDVPGHVPGHLPGHLPGPDASPAPDASRPQGAPSQAPAGPPSA
jgi:oligopeptide/dipeptide ABC transporter ATP-binding protein